MRVPSPVGGPNATDPITQVFAITPDDGTDLAICPRCLIIDAPGTVTMDLLGGSENVAVPLQAGFNPIRPTRVYASGTDSSLTIVGGF
jgi:hypothetical protein